MIRGLHIILLVLLANVSLFAQPAQIILDQQDGRITFAVDQVSPADNHFGWIRSASEMAVIINRDYSKGFSLDWTPNIIASSFAEVDNLYHIGEDVVFQMLMKAWCQHRPVVLSPDVIWLIICQQFSHRVNAHPEEFRNQLVSHKGKMELEVVTGAPLSENTDWDLLLSTFTSKIADNTNNDIAATLIADFSTTGTDERIASVVTLMDVVKQYFDYTVVFAICGIPTITLTGTPEDWQKVLDKTKKLGQIGMEWWTSELEPILEEFVKASEGNPDYWFWKDIVKKSRPRRIQGPSCGKRVKPLTRFDGWFLKFFPFDNRGRTPNYVTIGKSMFSETVAVPLKYIIVDDYGNILGSYDFELVAGIVGVTQNPETLAFTPKIGWFVRYYCSDDAISTF